MEPVTLTAAGIATLAFGEFVKAGMGKIAEKTIDATIEPLRAFIKKRFAGNQKAETAIAKIEDEGSSEALNKLSVYLDDEMEDPTFAQSLQQLAQEITNVQNTAERQYNNYGRDQINIENITGNPRIGGS
ncbi:hypothetical protein ACQ4M3_14115 [Leptolyngbya sp. AN03gr2]|uniref:hypothetical protein n=1 Tax=unclassified Leptolyngbya TaxID=2650499 RepID=UPI003D3235F6